MTQESSQLKGFYLDDVKHLIHPFTQLKAHLGKGPRIIARGEGVHVTDLEGNTYLDGISALWNVNVGHGQYEIGKAMLDQVNEIAFCSSFFGYSNLPAINLAKKLVALTPEGLNRVFFTCGGSETNESNLKIARYYNNIQGKNDKIKVISRLYGYHGVSMAALTATGMPNFWKNFEPLLPGFTHIPPAHCYHCPFDQVYGQCNIECAYELEKTIEKEGPRTVAAFIAEPVCGAGGVIPPPSEYFPIIRDICSKYEVLLILDEVITGFGRTGKMFACEHWKVTPDMMSLAKGITSGYIPLGAAVINGEIINTITEKAPPELPFLHGFTYNGHPVCCAAGLKNIEIIEREGLVENAARMGSHLLSRLEELREFDLVGDVRGLGLMAAIELVSDRDKKTGFNPPGKAGLMVTGKAYQSGLICRNTYDTVTLSPPLVISKEEIDTIVAILKESIGYAQGGLSAQ